MLKPIDLQHVRFLSLYIDIYIRGYGIDNSTSDKSESTNTLQLSLMNVERIFMFHKDVHVTWSHKCRKLRLCIRPIADKEWCQHVIDNCDCTGIETLEIFDIACFDGCANHSIDVRSESTREFLKSFASKFINLKILNMDCSQQYVTVKIIGI